MFWQEQKKTDARHVVPNDVVDVVYAIACRSLPVDHAYALFEALHAVLPWLGREPGTGVHPIHVADSGNGWMRPERPDDLLQLSRRTKLILRVPQSRLAAAQGLSGHTLTVAGHTLKVEQATVRPLSTHTTLFSRYLAFDEALAEDVFLARMQRELAAVDVQPKKMLCGIEKIIATPAKAIHARSLMVAELTVEQSVRLQQHGLGRLQHLGCGLFIPHKDIREVGQALD
jgi:CRISPR-associated protein Cas6